MIVEIDVYYIFYFFDGLKVCYFEGEVVYVVDEVEKYIVFGVDIEDMIGYYRMEGLLVRRGGWCRIVDQNDCVNEIKSVMFCEGLEIGMNSSCIK